MSMYNNPGLAATGFKSSMSQVNRVFIVTTLLSKNNYYKFWLEFENRICKDISAKWDFVP